MSIDRLQGLLHRFQLRARGFHAGPLCGIHEFGVRPGIGQLHLVRRGPLEAHHGAAGVERIEQPSLIFYPRPLQHRFVCDDRRGADMACADIELGAGADTPIAAALPPVLVLPLTALPGAGGLLDLLFAEAFAERCGRQQVVDRLFEVLVVLLLRHLIDSGQVADGTLAGLAHPRLARALTAMHDAPQQAWPLPRLARCAGMSRSAFADAFRRTVGMPAGQYLARYRIALAQDLLRRGTPLARVASEVGYGSSAALSRAFSAHCGVAPRRWRARLPA